MDRTEVLARRERLFRPPGGRTSTELEIVPRHAFSRRRRDELGLYLIHRQEPLCDADLEKLIPAIQAPPKKACEPAVLDPNEVSPLMLRQIIRTVADFYGASVVDVVSPRRDAKVMRPRQVAYYLCKTLTTRTFPAIGRAFGGRDHTTPMSGVRKMERLIPIDRELADEIAYLTAMLTEAP